MGSGQVVAVVSERSDGDQRDSKSEMTQKYLHSLGVRSNQVVRAEQAHGRKIAKVSPDDAGQTISGVDGLVTNVPGVYLGVVSADCEPILVFDPIRKAVGAIHVGWRGNVSGIISQAVLALQKSFGCQSKDLQVYIGPALGPCHARFSDPKEELPPEFHKYIIKRKNGAGWLDFWQATQEQFTVLGVPADQIENEKICTACHHDRFFSYRAAGRIDGEQLAAIGLKDN